MGGNSSVLGGGDWGNLLIGEALNNVAITAGGLGFTAVMPTRADLRDPVRRRLMLT